MKSAVGSDTNKVIDLQSFSCNSEPRQIAENVTDGNFSSVSNFDAEQEKMSDASPMLRIFPNYYLDSLTNEDNVYAKVKQIHCLKNVQNSVIPNFLVQNICNNSAKNNSHLLNISEKCSTGVSMSDCRVPQDQQSCNTNDLQPVKNMPQLDFDDWKHFPKRENLLTADNVNSLCNNFEDSSSEVVRENNCSAVHQGVQSRKSSKTKKLPRKTTKHKQKNQGLKVRIRSKRRLNCDQDNEMPDKPDDAQSCVVPSKVVNVPETDNSLDKPFKYVYLLPVCNQKAVLVPDKFNENEELIPCDEMEELCGQVQCSYNAHPGIHLDKTQGVMKRTPFLACKLCKNPYLNIGALLKHLISKHNLKQNKHHGIHICITNADKYFKTSDVRSSDLPMEFRGMCWLKDCEYGCALRSEPTLNTAKFFKPVACKGCRLAFGSVAGVVQHIEKDHDLSLLRHYLHICPEIYRKKESNRNEETLVTSSRKSRCPNDKVDAHLENSLSQVVKSENISQKKSENQNAVLCETPSNVTGSDEANVMCNMSQQLDNSVQALPNDVELDEQNKPGEVNVTNPKYL